MYEIPAVQGFEEYGSQYSTDPTPTFKQCLNKTIKTIEIVNDELKIGFTDGYNLLIKDAGQSCCEHRHMSTDDVLNDYIDARFTGAELRKSECVESNDVHEVQWLIIKTDLGPITFVNHNEHNGYYGGFDVVAELSNV